VFILVGILAGTVFVWANTVLPPKGASRSGVVQPDSAQFSCDKPDDLVSQARQLRAQWRRSSLEQAITKYSEARRCWQAIGDLSREAETLKAVGDIYVYLSDYAKANQTYTDALTLRQRGTDRAEEADALGDVAFSLVFLNQFEKAHEVANQAVKLTEGLENQRHKGRALSVLTTTTYFTGGVRSSIDIANQALLILRDTQEHELLGQTLLALGYAYNDLDDVETALTFYNRALIEWRAAKNVWGETKTLASLGVAHTLLGDRDAALEALRVTLPVAELMGDRLGRGIALNNIAYVYQTVGELDVALDYYLKALANYQEMQFKVGEAATLRYCADIYAMMGNTQTALNYYDRALPLSREIKDTLLEADALNSLGSINFKLGDRPKAFNLFQQALAEYRKGNHWRGQSSSLNNIGYYYETSGERTKARESYNEALVFARSSGDREGAGSILYNLARVEAALGSEHQARVHIEESLKLNEASRAKVASPELRVSYFASIHQHYQFYIDLLMQLHRSRPSDGFDLKALQASERARARSLLELLSQAHLDIHKSADPQLLQHERTLRTALNAEYLKTLGAPGKEPRSDIRKLEIEYEDIRNQIRTANAKYASIALPESLNLHEVQRELLDPDTAILEYSLGENRSFLWVVTSNELKSYELPARSKLEAEVQNLTDSLAAFASQSDLSNRKRVAIADLEDAYWKQSAKLSGLVFKDGLSHITAKRLVIVADGALQRVPYAALIRPQEPITTKPTPLIEEFEVVSLPSISVLAVLKRQIMSRERASRSVAILADPVFESTDPRISVTKSASRSGATRDVHSAPQSGSELRSAVTRALRDTPLANNITRLVFSRQEAQAILSLAPRATSFAALDFKASRATAISGELSKYGIIHFATHGLLNNKHPELSGILLSMVDEKGRAQDGFLQLSDIYDLNLPADLVVLSACETGLGRTVNGEGLIGLTRGFMYAGAARIVASLWKVDDAATAALMEQFYREMFTNGLTPAAALRVAQRQISQQKRWRSPYYWAGFVLQGEWR